MISVYSGTPGSGKSYHAVVRMYDYAVLQKRLVISNVKLSLPESRYVYCPNKVLEPDYVKALVRDWWKSHRFKEDGVLLVIDEAQLIFNTRNWSNALRSGWVEFMTQSRHMGVCIILVAQSMSMLDKQMRCLAEYDVRHRKLANYGLKGRIMSLLFLGRLHVAITYFSATHSEKVGSEFFVTRPKYFKLYDSYNWHESVGG